MRRITLNPPTRKIGTNFSYSDIAQMYKDGVKITVISKKTKRAIGNIYDILSKQGVSINRKKNSRIAQEKLKLLMLEDKKAGMKVREIAKKYKMTLGNTCNIIYNV